MLYNSILYILLLPYSLDNIVLKYILLITFINCDYVYTIYRYTIICILITYEY